MINTSSDLYTLPNTLAQLSHAYIVQGIDTQKRQKNVLGLVKSLLCQVEHDIVGDYCDNCHSCQLFNADTHPDFMMINPDQGSIGVDEIRQLSEFLFTMSQLSGNQVVVLEHAENMTENASNALLKTLEEPTNKSFIFLLCENKASLMPTILSRCQFLQVKNNSKEQLKAQYPEIPDYIIGFSNNSQSDLQTWQDEQKLEQFTHVYQLFIQWLKKQIPSFMLTKEVANKPLMSSFLLYLIEKRIRQLMLKQPTGQQFNDVNQASAKLTGFRQHALVIKGQNKSLALTDFLAQIEKLIS